MGEALNATQPKIIISFRHLKYGEKGRRRKIYFSYDDDITGNLWLHNEREVNPSNEVEAVIIWFIKFGGVKPWV